MPFCSNCGTETVNEASFCSKCGSPLAGEAPSASYAQGTPTNTTSEMEVDRLLKDSQTQDLWFRRVVAYIVDWIIVVIVSSIIAGVAVLAYGLGAFFTGFSGFFFPFSSLAGILFGGIAALLCLLYFTLADYAYHTTIGKNVMGLRVKTIDSSRLGIEKSLIRNVSKIHPLLLLLDLIGGFFTKVLPGQKFSDSIARTNVERNKS